MDCDRLTLPEIPVPKERPPWFIHPALPGTGSDELTLKVGGLTSTGQVGVPPAVVWLDYFLPIYSLNCGIISYSHIGFIVRCTVQFSKNQSL